MWEKKILLVTSNFFFSHNVFKSWLLLMRQNKYLWSKGFTLYQTTKSLDWSNLKAFADNTINLTKQLKFVVGSVENFEGKGENVGYQHFLLFLQCYQKASFSRLLKVGIVCQRVKPLWQKGRNCLLQKTSTLFVILLASFSSTLTLSHSVECTCCM